ncbi:MAG TPA: methylamine utilization protein MauJ [Candidatus Avalokitesvara rifleensis]|uniref:methylamine utilization protein MauJ n=1 Tax=Candidatus Avalokitesvara rifleensis TaxID=3367620 RepID=UPI00271388C7|nr:hypothetical protein [Candidatus Brocadiales bacterium]
MVEAGKGLFVRFRKGTKLVISPTIFDDTSTFLVEAKKTSNIKDLLDSSIKEIGDGLGWGVHPESTWYQVIKDFLSLYANLGRPDTGLAKVQVEFLEKIVSEETPEKIWTKAKKHILENIEQFSGWNLHLPLYSLFPSGIFCEGGKYYAIEKGERIRVIGMRTHPEELFEFIKNQLIREYGFLRRIIKMVCLYSLTCDMKTNSASYPEQICIMLPEEEHGSLLGYTWYLLGPMPYQIGAWRPRNTFCDLYLLCTDLLNEFAVREGKHIPKVYEQPEYIKLLSKKEDPWPEYPYQLEIALETELQFGDSDDYYFSPFEGRSFRWVNGTRDYYPLLIAPTKATEDFEETFSRVMRFLSILIYDLRIPVPIVCVGGKNTKRINPWIRAPRKPATAVYPEGFTPLVDFALTDKRKLALAIFKDATNAKNVFYKFLCLWKITTIPFKKDGNNKHINWINSSIEQGLNYYGFSDCVTALRQKGTSDIGKHLKEGGRAAIAHVNLTEKTLQINPDDFKDHDRIRKLLPLMEALAAHMIKSNYLD